jgi:hypothetical protein
MRKERPHVMRISLYRFLPVLVLLATLLFAPAFAKSETQSQPAAQPQSDFSSILYETPTVAKLSRLYWGLGKFKTAEDPKAHVNNYLKINECDLFKEFGHNEFEWRKIVDTTYDFLQKKQLAFSRNFAIVMPLHFSEYNSEKNAFEIWDKYKIKNSRSFESKAFDFNDNICGSAGKDIPGYPRSLFIELSRPFNLSYVPMPPERAEEFIKYKEPQFLALRDKQKTQEGLYYSRDIYMVMKVRIFSYKEDVDVKAGYRLAKVLGVLDRYEIYQDKDLKTLLYAEDVNIRIPRSDTEATLKKQYQERLKARAESKR